MDVQTQTITASSRNSPDAKPQYCLLVPHYNHDKQFLAFLPELLALDLPIVIVDDGSRPESLSALETYCESLSTVFLIRHAFNRGKGGAVKTGLVYARGLGFTHAIQIDADGQHNAEDIARFKAISEDNPNTLICGNPVFDESAPKSRVYGRKVTDFWVAIETLSFKVKDALCGFRVYPLTAVEKIVDAYYLGNRMDFDPELLVKGVWIGTDIKFIDTHVVYPEESVSHFHFWHDNKILVWLHVRLMLGWLKVLPRLIVRRLVFRRLAGAD